MLARLTRLLLDAVAPRRCAGCDAVSDGPICPDCDEQLAAMPVPRPRPMRQGAAYGGFEFEEPVRAVLHRGKYGGDRAALRALAAVTSRRVEATSRPSGPPPPPDAIVAVPLGARRRRQRGYNQADIIARVLADIQRAPVLEGLRRVRETRPQSTCDENGRRLNVAGAFAWQGPSLAGAGLWLVDDVLTTGATLEAAAAALRVAGASRIDVVVVAVVP